MRSLFIALAIAALGGCGDDGSGSVVPCEGPNGPCIEILPGAGVQEELQTALIEAQPGDVIFIRAGTYELDRDLSLDVDGVTIRGEGMDATILSFASQTDGAQGILVTADDFTIEDLAIEDPVGDGLKVEGTSGVTIRRVRAEWTGGPSPDNGAYGLYPVQCTNVLIEESVVIGSADAGIYVGQSSNIIVRNSRAEYNVAGIEIENSSDADVYGNVATNNTGGLLIFNVPGLQLKNGARTRAYDNQIFANNQENFSRPGNIINLVPKGTGVVLLAAHEVELFGNEIRDNQTVNMSVVSYAITMNPYDDPEYNPYSDTIYVYDNMFGAGGEMPVGAMGALIITALGTIMDPPIVVPDIVFDGFLDPAKALPEDPRVLQPEFNLCFRNADADFANLDTPAMHEMVSTSLAPHDCEHPMLPAVMIPGV